MNTTSTGRATIETTSKGHAMATPMQYLDKAMTRLRDLGLVPEKTEEAPIVALLNRVSDLDNDKVVAIARTLSQASLFNQVVREQVASMKLGERYAQVTDGFNSIRDDAKTMVQQVEDGRIDTFERLANIWQKATRGDIAGRFDKIKKVYLDVVKDSKDQIEREQLILQAYLDFRGAMKESEVLRCRCCKKPKPRCKPRKRSSKPRSMPSSKPPATTSLRGRSSSSPATRSCATCRPPRTAIRSVRTSPIT